MHREIYELPSPQEEIHPKKTALFRVFRKRESEEPRNFFFVFFAVAVFYFSFPNPSHPNASPCLELVQNWPEECLIPIIAKKPCQELTLAEPSLPCEGSWAPWPKRFTLSHIVGTEGKIDFSTNYSSASFLFAPDFRCGGLLPLLDLQGHRFDDTTYAASAGIIFRYIPTVFSSMQEIIGLNAYYDYRQGSLGYHQQFSLGLEILASRWELRANGYIPFGNKKNFPLCSAATQGDADTHENNRSVSYGFNGEIGGYPLKTPLFLLYLGSGPYFISGRDDKPKTVGVEARIRPQYKDYIALDLSYNWDPLFHSVYQAEIILYAPLYQLSKRRQVGNCSRGLTVRQIYQNVERFDVMPLGPHSCLQP